MPLDLVEEDDGVRLAPYRLGELAALLVPHVPGRRSDQPADCVPLLVLAHVEADHALLAVEQRRGESFRQLGLPDAGRTEEDERADGALWVADAGAGPDDGISDQGDRLVLADHPLGEDLVQAQQLLALALLEARDGNAGPGRDDLGDLVLRDDLVQQPVLALFGGERVLLRRETALQLGQGAVPSAARLRSYERSASSASCRTRSSS